MHVVDLDIRELSELPSEKLNESIGQYVVIFDRIVWKKRTLHSRYVLGKILKRYYFYSQKGYLYDVCDVGIENSEIIYHGLLTKWLKRVGKKNEPAREV